MTYLVCGLVGCIVGMIIGFYFGSKWSKENSIEVGKIKGDRNIFKRLFKK